MAKFILDMFSQQYQTDRIKVRKRKKKLISITDIALKIHRPSDNRGFTNHIQNLTTILN